jgi:hypothetical protein
MLQLQLTVCTWQPWVAVTTAITTALMTINDACPLEERVEVCITV